MHDLAPDYARVGSYLLLLTSFWFCIRSGGDQRFPGGRTVTALPLLLYGLPVTRQLEDLCYAFVATVRSKLPNDAPYCSRHPEECR